MEIGKRPFRNWKNGWYFTPGFIVKGGDANEAHQLELACQSAGIVFTKGYYPTEHYAHVSAKDLVRIAGEVLTDESRQQEIPNLRVLESLIVALASSQGEER